MNCTEEGAAIFAGATDDILARYATACCQLAKAIPRKTSCEIWLSSNRTKGMNESLFCVYHQNIQSISIRVIKCKLSNNIPRQIPYPFLERRSHGFLGD